MLRVVSIGIAIVVATVIIHAFGTTKWVEPLFKRLLRSERHISYLKAIRVLITTVLFMLFLHTAEVLVWAVFYFLLPGKGVFEHFEEAVYFSFTTFTTLGYGDITLPAPLHHMTGIQALSGILLAGWSTALFFVVFQKVWTKLRSEGKKEAD